ncbi:DUF2628 domain-containing protein [Devosia sp.]|uniref:DUF2628 domain-containing protein n=1 Tax=Devosia sp. TaxID=1871048 RepID=UPI002F1A230B
MTLYAIFERGTPVREAPVSVPERFSWLAVLLPPVFAVLHGLWLELVIFAVAAAALALASPWLGGAAAFWLYVLLAVLIGFEAPSLRRAALRRRGWTCRTEIIAAAGDLAEAAWLQRAGVTRP